MQTEKRVILALDGMAPAECKELLAAIWKRIYGVKAHDFIDRNGPDYVHMLRIWGARNIFGDFKLHDTPRTAKLRAAAFAHWGYDIITVHASGGADMIEAAREGFGEKGEIFAVTLLTSLDEGRVNRIYNGSINGTMTRLMEEAYAAGRNGLKGSISGFVCSALEVGLFSKVPDYSRLKFLVPGIRSLGISNNDQKRVGTPRDAVDAGASYLVIGEPITKAADPIAALDQIEAELSVKI